MLVVFIIVAAIVMIVAIVVTVMLVTRHHITTNPLFSDIATSNPVHSNDVKTIKDSLNFVNTKLFCKMNIAKSDENDGPIWKYWPFADCDGDKIDGKGILQDFWLDGCCSEVLANYSTFAKDSTYVDMILSKFPDTLQDQLMTGKSGTWNDDTIWYLLAFVAMYDYGVSVGNPDKFKRELQWANDNYERICTTEFNPITCQNWNQTFTTTWWQREQDDPSGMNTYRNSITNGLLMLLGMRLYNLYGKFNATFTKDQYYNNSKTIMDFMLAMRTDSGLLVDGMHNDSRNSNTAPATCKWDERYFSYIQGVAIGAFALFSVAAYERNDMPAYNKAMNFTRDLIEVMTYTPENNYSNAPGNCNVNILNRKPCLTANGQTTTDQNTCLQNSSCCFDSNDLTDASCYSKDSPAKNPFLVTVGKISILTEYNSTLSDNSAMFKGIFTRYLGTATRALITFFDTHPEALTGWDKYLVYRSVEFLRQNFDWVVYNAWKDNLYSDIWQFTREQTTHAVNKWRFNVVSTYSVIDLFNSCISLQGMQK